MSDHAYLVALGSNRRHHRFGGPRDIIKTAARMVGQELGEVVAMGPVIDSAPFGPSLRRYANGALILRTNRDPEALLAALKRIEHSFGRRPGGQRWSSRVLDLDIVLWSGSSFSARGLRRRHLRSSTFAAQGLTIPHPLFRNRAFVLGPAARIAPKWRDPVTHRTLRQLHARLTGHRPLPR